MKSQYITSLFKITKYNSMVIAIINQITKLNEVDIVRHSQSVSITIKITIYKSK